MTALASESSVTKLYLTGLQSLDPIGVYLEDVGRGQGRITITCYDRAWTAYWGGMGDKSVSHFVRSCGVDYLVGSLFPRIKLAKKLERQEKEYLGRILRAVQAGLNAREKP